MFLLDVRVSIEPEYDAALNEWYHTHVPRLVSLPGYESGRRYVGASRGPRYAALYEIKSAIYLPRLLGENHSQREPLTLSEWSEWDARFVRHMTHGSTNLYDAGECDQLLLGDWPIVEFRFDGGNADDLRTLCGRALPTEARASPVAASFLKKASQDDVQWLNTRPEHLVILQSHDLEAALALAEDDRLRIALTERGAQDIEAVVYTQIARHWRIPSAP
ncbi:MAG: hypothetical protein ABSE69_20705 [Roseiarcus sp.]|jgi:hypothetical protein